MIQNNLSAVLGQRRIKQSELAASAGISKTTVLTLYNNRAKAVSFDVLNKICKALNCQVSDILYYKDDDK